MQADGRQSACVVELAEVARQPVRRHGVTVGPGEHVAAVEVVPSGGGALGELACAVGTQGSDGGAVQGDDPLAVSRLGRAQGDVAVVLLELPGDDRGAGAEVDVAPAQPAGFAAPQPAQRDQVVGGVQPVALDGVEEPSRAKIAGQANLDLCRKARQDRRPVDELIQLYVLPSAADSP